MVIRNLQVANEKVAMATRDVDNITAPEYFRCQKEQAVAFTQVVNHAFSEEAYDKSTSFLANVLRMPDVSYAIATKVCQIRFPVTPISNGERRRLCSFLIQTLYDGRVSNPDCYKAIEMVLLLNEYPEIYDLKTKEIIKQEILSGRLKFVYADMIAASSDEKIRLFLTGIAKGTGMSRATKFIHAWVATCMLAKAGDNEARAKVKEIANGLKDIEHAHYIPLGLAYVGNKDMIERLFEMLKSDLRKWFGEDAIPQEIQLAHEAAVALSLCVKGFPQYDTFSPFTAEDKAKCLKWVEENRDTFVIENKPPLFYFTKTRFKQVRR